MRLNLMPAPLKLACALTLPLFLSGCLSTGQHESRGVKLTEAMDSAAKGDHRDLGGSSHHDDSSDGGGVSVGGWAGICSATYDESEYGWQVPMDVSYSIPFRGDIEGITHYSLTPLSLEDERNFLGLYLGGATVDLKSGSVPDLGAKNTWMFEIGLTYRRYLNSSRNTISPYVAANLGYQILVWDYRNPIIAGGDTIRSDELGGIAGSVAFGISTRRDRRLSFFGEVGLGGTLFLDTTSRGFENDVFDDFGCFIFKGGLCFKF